MNSVQRGLHPAAEDHRQEKNKNKETRPNGLEAGTNEQIALAPGRFRRSHRRGRSKQYDNTVQCSVNRVCLAAGMKNGSEDWADSRGDRLPRPLRVRAGMGPREELGSVEANGGIGFVVVGLSSEGPSFRQTDTIEDMRSLWSAAISIAAFEGGQLLDTQRVFRV